MCVNISQGNACALWSLVPPPICKQWHHNATSTENWGYRIAELLAPPPLMDLGVCAVFHLSASAESPEQKISPKLLWSDVEPSS